MFRLSLQLPKQKKKHVVIFCFKCLCTSIPLTLFCCNYNKNQIVKEAFFFLYLISSIETFIINNSSPNSSSSISQEINSIDYNKNQVVIDPNSIVCSISSNINNNSIAQQLNYCCSQSTTTTTMQLNDQAIVNYINENDMNNENIINKFKCFNKRKQVYFFKPY